MLENKKADYKGFGEHLQEWDDKGIPHGMSDLVMLANKYNTPIPEFKNGDLLWKKD